MRIVVAYIASMALLSLAAFIVYGIDKRLAQTNGRRVPEKTLHMLALLGGWPGALMGQRLFRHKTQKLSFRIVLWLCIMLHLSAAGATTYLLHR